MAWRLLYKSLDSIFWGNMLSFVSKLLTFVLCIGLLLLSGCGDLGNQPIVQEVKNKRFSVDCKIDHEALGDILRRDVNAEISCVETTLKFFIEFVVSPKPEYLSRAELGIFLDKYMEEEADSIKAWMDILFKFNYLVMDSSNKSYIHVSQLENLFDVVRYFNSQFYQLYNHVQKLDESHSGLRDYNAVREQIKVFGTNLAQNLKSLYRNPNKLEEIVDLEKLFQDLLGDDIGKLESASSFLFIKRIVLGGLPSKITHLEMSNLFEKIPLIVLIYTDAMAISKINDLNLVDKIELFANIATSFRQVLHHAQSSQVEMFDFDELANALNGINSLDFDISKFKQEILKLKDVLVGNNSESITNRDLIQISNHLLTIGDKVRSFKGLYNIYREDIESKNAFSVKLDRKKAIARGFYSYMVNDFEKSINSYRFYRGKPDLAVISNQMHRTFSGFAEQIILEYALNRFLQYYGKFDHRESSLYRIEYEKMVELLMDFSEFLVDQKIVSRGREANLVETILLNTNLFQYEGDGNTSLNIKEAVPFVISVLGAVKISQRMKEHFDIVCPKVEDDLVDYNCYRNNLVELIKDQDYFAGSFAGLRKYIVELSEVDQLVFVDELLSFTRSCPYADVNVTKGDMVTFAIALISIENTIVRFDTENVNNLLDRNEVKIAYDFYADALKRLLQSAPGWKNGDKQNLQQRLSRAIFYYLVDYRSTPASVGDLFKVLGYQIRVLRPGEADRLSLAAIMKTISLSSSTNRKNPSRCYRPTHQSAIAQLLKDNHLSSQNFESLVQSSEGQGGYINSLVIADLVQVASLEELTSIFDALLKFNGADEAIIRAIIVDIEEFHSDKIDKKKLKKLKKWLKRKKFD